jgi:elongation factor P
MLEHTDLRKGVKIVIDREPYEVLDYSFSFKGRGSSTVQVKLKNLITGRVVVRTVHANERFEEAEIKRKKIKFLFTKGNDFNFCLIDDPRRRFILKKDILDIRGNFLKQNDIIEGVFFNEGLINIQLPIKMQFKVISASPGLKGGRETAGTKPVIIETGFEIQAPLFIKEGDIIEVNTETGEYVRRI